MSARIKKVTVGSVKIGDIIDGYRVTGFGRAWRLDSEDNCAFGAQPWETVRVCYAYGEKATATAPEPVAAPVEPKPAAPKWGSREWKEDRMAKLPALIAICQDRHDANIRSASVSHRRAALDALESADRLRAELAALEAELIVHTT